MNARQCNKLLWSLLFLAVTLGVVALVAWVLPPFLSLEHGRTVMLCIVAIVLLSISMLAVLYGLLRSEILTPLRQLAEQMARIERPDDLPTRLALTGNDEVDNLVQTIRGMLTRLQQSEHLYQVLADASPDMVFILDREGRIDQSSFGFLAPGPPAAEDADRHAGEDGSRNPGRT